VGVTSERIVGSVLELSLAALELGDGDEVDRHAGHLPMRGKWTLWHRHFRVLDVVPFDEEDGAPFVGLLQVEAA
jgi:hypothetical protein